MLATESDDLNSIPLTHILEGETDSQKLFSDIHTHMPWNVCPPIHMIRNIISNYVCSVGRGI